jgi:hypothetical protein
MSGRHVYADVLREAVEDITTRIIEVGQVLAEAKLELGTTELYAMVTDDLGRSKRWAQQLISIASNPALTGAKHVSLLPTDTASLYDLSRLEAADVNGLVDSDVLTSSSSRRDVKAMVTRIRESRERGTDPHLSDLPTPQTVTDLVERMKADPDHWIDEVDGVEVINTGKRCVQPLMPMEVVGLLNQAADNLVELGAWTASDLDGLQLALNRINTKLSDLVEMVEGIS